MSGGNFLAPAAMPGMELPSLVPIEYRGELVALVSRERVHIISPRLLSLPKGDPDLRFVAFMCLCCGEVLNGRLAAPYSNALGEAWARAALIDPRAIPADAVAEQGLADELRVPLDQLRVAMSADAAGGA